MLDSPRPDRRRPVLILSRPVLIRVLNTVTVAEITSTVRGAATEVVLGTQEGLKRDSCVNLVNLFTVPQDRMRRFVGYVRREKMVEVCRAINISLGCD